MLAAIASAAGDINSGSQARMISNPRSDGVTSKLKAILDKGLS